MMKKITCEIVRSAAVEAANGSAKTKPLAEFFEKMSHSTLRLEESLRLGGSLGRKIADLTKEERTALLDSFLVSMKDKMGSGEESELPGKIKRLVDVADHPDVFKYARTGCYLPSNYNAYWAVQEGLVEVATSLGTVSAVEGTVDLLLAVSSLYGKITSPSEKLFTETASGVCKVLCKSRDEKLLAVMAEKIRELVSMREFEIALSFVKALGAIGGRKKAEGVGKSVRDLCEFVDRGLRTYHGGDDLPIWIRNWCEKELDEGR
ncbi:Uncharacterised protein [Candidatus Gugararchaeum adminiculabundum]|nr:Uncharacterised protein [Candidatus Gugararchaeum adminiculabundum]